MDPGSYVGFCQLAGASVRGMYSRASPGMAQLMEVFCSGSASCFSRRPEVAGWGM